MTEVMRVESRESSDVKSYRDLQVWKKAMDFVQAVYSATQTFPKEELYSLTNQIRRSAVSIPSNIAEGSSRRGTQEFLRYINISTGSLAEIETQLIIAGRLSYLSETSLNDLLKNTDELSRMLQGLYVSLQAKLPKKPTRLSTLDSNH